MPLFKLRFHKDGSVRSWKQYSRATWVATSTPQFGTGDPYWDVKENPIIFEAHHWSSILAGLTRIGIDGILVFPDTRTEVQHQYWVGKHHQYHQMSTMTRPNAREMSEARNHFHKVLVKNPVVNTPGRGYTTLITKTSAIEIPANHFSNNLRAKGAMINKAPDGVGSTLDEVASTCAGIAKALLPQ